MQNKQQGSIIDKVQAQIGDDGDFQAFMKKLPKLTSIQNISNQLKGLIGKKKSLQYAQKIFSEMSSKITPKHSVAQKQLEEAIDDEKDYKQFISKIDNFLTAEDVIRELTPIIGKKKSQILGQKYFNQVLMQKVKNKKSTMKEIQEQMDDEKQFQIFKQKIDKCLFSTDQELINELASIIGKKAAQKFGEKLFKQKFSNIKKLMNDQKNQKVQKFEKLGKNEKDKKVLNPEKKSENNKKIQKKNQYKTLLQIEKQINDEEEFKKFKFIMHNCDLIEDLADELSSYTGKIRAKQLATKLFKQLGKDKIIINKIDYLYRKLKQQQIDGDSISKISHLIQNGKKSAVKRMLIQILGPVGGKRMFDEFTQNIEEKISHPASGSRKLKEKNGLYLFEYIQQLDQHQKESAKTLIVFGQTGCGKSTFLNAIVNYLAQVQMEDYFRYKIVVQNEENQLTSITTKITNYYIKNTRTKAVFRLIDTPGFGDTAGIQKDKQIVEMVKNMFKKDVESVHNILFLMKASTTRVTIYQRYVFQSIMDLFNRDIAPNFVFIFTFSDSGQPQVLQSVKDPQYGFGSYWDQISEPKYLQVNNCGIFQKINIQDKIKLGYWEIGMMCMQKLFQKIHKIAPKSLSMSKQLLDKKQCLMNKMKVTQQTIQLGIAKRENLCEQIQKVIKFQQQIDNNKNFTYQVDVIHWYSERTNHNVTRCLNCQNTNCHQSCRYGDGQDKKNCVAFNQTEFCTVCPGKCHFSLHKNDHNLRKTKKVKQKRQNAINKQKYENSCKDLKLSQKLISQLINNIQQVSKTVQGATRQMIEIQKDLAKNQMSKKKPQSTITYMEHLIANELRDQKTGYKNRINQMNSVINDMKFYQKIANNQQLTSSKLDEQIKGYKMKQIQELLQKSKPGIFDKIKNFFSF